MNESPATAFTASEIARSLGRSRQRVQELLRGAPASQTVVVSGNATGAWTIEALPHRVQTALKKAAHKHGYDSALRLLSVPPKRWQPATPLNRIAPDALARAGKLRDALQTIVPKYGFLPPGESTAQIIAEGLAAYQSAVGNAVSARHIRRLLDRTVARDGGAGEWNRLELYLDERPVVIPSGSEPSASCELPALREAINNVIDPANPTTEEGELVWINACEEIARIAAAGTPRRKAIASAVDELTRAPGLAGKSRQALEKALRRRLAKWEESGGELAAVADGRKSNGHANGRVELTESDRLAILDQARRCGGRLSQAWRELIRSNALSPALLARFKNLSGSKSYVPHSIRDQLAHEITMLEPWRRGPRAAALAGAYLNRDPETIQAGGWFQADDLTAPLYFRTISEDGALQIMRGQWLLMIDVRSLMALGFVLIPERNYSAFHIRNLITRVADEHGLPREGFYFENSAWKTSRLLKGRQQEIPWATTETGLRSLGLRFQHARYPRGKVVERVLGALQNEMEGDPGYCGRDERSDRFERVYRAKLDAEAGRIDPAEAFWSKEEWYARLTELCEIYNETPQEGKYCAGRSPRETFEASFGGPLVKLTGSVRHLLATHRMREKVTGNGIRIQFGKRTFRYKGEASGRFIGREVECFFSPESPETLSFTSPDGSEVHTVEREISVPAMDAPREVLAAAHAQNEAHNRHARELYRALKPRFSEKFETKRFRTTVADEATVARGEAMARHNTEISDERNRMEVTERKLDVAAKRLGIGRVNQPRDPDRARQALDGMNALRKLGIGSQTEEANER